jgi:LytS/YehU family sensor histidine kinase
MAIGSHSVIPKAVIAEDEPVLRAELRETLAKLWPELVVCAEAEDGIEALHALETHAPEQKIHIASASAGGMLRLTISDSGTGFDPDRKGDGTEGIRARLSGLYGTAASFVLRRRESGGTEAVMEIPYEAMQAAPG